MNEDTQKPPIVTTAQQESDSVLARISATFGICSTLLFYLPIIVRVSSWGLARGLDLGNMSGAMVLGMFLGFIAFILGMIAVFRKGRKRLSKIGIVTGGLAVFVPLLIPLFA